MALSKQKTAVSTKPGNLIAYSHPESLISEQFRMIQTNIRFTITDQNSRVFLITSPSPWEGKSTAAANLAVSVAVQKDKVLLIDANLRKPALHTIFNIENTMGLRDVLTGKASLGDAVHQTEISSLDVLPSGKIPMNPGELLGSAHMEKMLQTALQSYDVVLIDSYSVIDVTDAKLLANQCDGVVLVVRSGKTTSKKVIEAQKELEFAKSKIVGVILNEW